MSILLSSSGVGCCFGLCTLHFTIPIGVRNLNSITPTDVVPLIWGFLLYQFIQVSSSIDFDQRVVYRRAFEWEISLDLFERDCF